MSGSRLLPSVMRSCVARVGWVVNLSGRVAIWSIHLLLVARPLRMLVGLRSHVRRLRITLPARLSPAVRLMLRLRLRLGWVFVTWWGRIPGDNGIAPGLLGWRRSMIESAYFHTWPRRVLDAMLKMYNSPVVVGAIA